MGIIRVSVIAPVINNGNSSSEKRESDENQLKYCNDISIRLVHVVYIHFTNESTK